EMSEIKRTDSVELAAAVAAKNAKKSFADMTPRDMVARYLEQGDADKDGKISIKDELSKLDERMQRLASADANHDGFLESRELLSAAASNLQKMKSGKGGGGSGRRGGGEGGPPAGGGGPAGGE